MADLTGSTLVAEIEIGGAPIAFETTMQDIMVPEDEEAPLEEEIKKPVEMNYGQNSYQPEEEEEEEVQQTEEETPQEEEEEDEEALAYKDY